MLKRGSFPQRQISLRDDQRLLIGVSVLFIVVLAADSCPAGKFRAGVVAVDTTPTEFPVLVNGSFTERRATKALDRLKSRAVVFDDGQTQLAIVVVDNLMMPRTLLDDAKKIAAEATGIPTSHILISATHTHSAPAVMGCLGSRADPAYSRFLGPQIARSIELAAEARQPATIGWIVVTDDAHNHCRRWIFRPDRMRADPFGKRSVRAHMHPGHNSPNHIGPAGPADTDLSLLSLQTKDGQPLCVVANYAMHYFGSPALSSDFCGRFGEALAGLIEADPETFVGMMSQGTSGDSYWADYSRPPRRTNLNQYTAEIARIAADAYARIEHHEYVSLAAAEATLKLARRTPDEERLAWARPIMERTKGRQPKNHAEVYAHEAQFLHDEPKVEIKLQALRIGELGITALPNEVYGITGLKLKLQSPLTPTFNIELANGAQGYIPPPEQHVLGGYTTWPARTAGLEIEAEPRIVETLLKLLDQVSGKTRRPFIDPEHAYSKAVRQSKPATYWRLGEIAGDQAMDAVGERHAFYEPGVVRYLDGPAGTGFSGGTHGNRAAHLAGGRVKAAANLTGTYSVELWVWNGLPHDARPVTGYFVSCGGVESDGPPGDHLGICGTHRGEHAGKLLFFNGDDEYGLLFGRTVLQTRTWQHIVLVRDGENVTVYLNGEEEPEIRGVAKVTRPDEGDHLFLGGRCDNFANLEGKLDEAALYDRALTAEEVSAHFKAAGRVSE